MNKLRKVVRQDNADEAAKIMKERRQRRQDLRRDRGRAGRTSIRNRLISSEDQSSVESRHAGDL